MSASASDDFEATSRCGSLDANSEWRSIEQVENGTPSTSPPYYDSDDDDNGVLFLLILNLFFIHLLFDHFCKLTCETEKKNNNKNQRINEARDQV